MRSFGIKTDWNVQELAGRSILCVFGISIAGFIIIVVNVFQNIKDLFVFFIYSSK